MEQFGVYDFLTLVRVPLFLLIGIEAIATFFVYQYGYVRFKPTNIIQRLAWFFLIFGVTMVYQAFLPFALVTNIYVHRVLTGVLIVLLFPMLLAVRAFRLASVNEEKKTGKPLPDLDKPKK